MEDVKRAVVKEMDGPGRLLGYRALHNKIRELHGLNVPRNLVYNVMADVNPKGLEKRGGVGQPQTSKEEDSIHFYCKNTHVLLEFAQARSFSSSVFLSTFPLVFLLILHKKCHFPFRDLISLCL